MSARGRSRLGLVRVEQRHTVEAGLYESASEVLKYSLSFDGEVIFATQFIELLSLACFLTFDQVDDSPGLFVESLLAVENKSLR